MAISSYGLSGLVSRALTAKASNQTPVETFGVWPTKKASACAPTLSPGLFLIVASNQPRWPLSLAAPAKPVLGFCPYSRSVRSISSATSASSLSRSFLYLFSHSSRSSLVGRRHPHGPQHIMGWGAWERCPYGPHIALTSSLRAKKPQTLPFFQLTTYHLCGFILLSMATGHTSCTALSPSSRHLAKAACEDEPGGIHTVCTPRAAISSNTFSVLAGAKAVIATSGTAGKADREG